MEKNQNSRLVPLSDTYGYEIQLHKILLPSAVHLEERLTVSQSVNQSVSQASSQSGKQAGRQADRNTQFGFFQ